MHLVIGSLLAKFPASTVELCVVLADCSGLIGLYDNSAVTLLVLGEIEVNPGRALSLVPGTSGCEADDDADILTLTLLIWEAFC